MSKGIRTTARCGWRSTSSASSRARSRCSGPIRAIRSAVRRCKATTTEHPVRRRLTTPRLNVPATAACESVRLFLATLSRSQTMHKILAIAVLLALCGAARAADGLDRSKLSEDENAIINDVCSSALKQGVGSFNTCVAQQAAALHDHPTPDRSGLSPSRSRAIARACSYRLHDGIASYNDCLRKAIAEQKPSGKQAIEDELTPNYAKVMTDDEETDEPQPVHVAAVSLPAPRAALTHRPDHLAQKTLTAAEL